MKFTFNEYVLNAKAPLSSKAGHLQRKGALLCLSFDNGMKGYADCHPWIEFGDPPIDEQLKHLAEGKLTRMLERSVEYAKKDAHARNQQYNLFQEISIPKSHALMPLEETETDSWHKPLIKAGFTRVKLKLGADTPLKSLVRLCQDLDPSELKLRLDFNGSLKYENALRLLEGLGTLVDRIDFIEDPMPFNPTTWADIRKRFAISLAADEESNRAIGEQDAADVLVLKPAKQNPSPFHSAVTYKQRVVVTSYLDHPVGQLNAALVASLFPGEVHGLLSHHLFENNLFSERLKQRDSVLIPPLGTGIGYDDLLEKLDWRT